MSHRQHRPLFERMRDFGWFMRTIALTETFVLLFVFYSPGVRAAVETLDAPVAGVRIRGNTEEERLSNTLQAIKDNALATKTVVDARVRDESNFIDVILNFFGLSVLRIESLDALIELNEGVRDLHGKVLRNFAAVQSTIEANKLAPEVMRRHRRAVEEYSAAYATLREYILAALDAKSLHDQQAAIDTLNQFLQQHRFRPSAQPHDPDNLPFSVPSAERTRAPATSDPQLGELIHGETAPSPMQTFLGGLIRSAHAQPAEVPGPADLAESVDVQLTDALRTRAQALGNDPVEIYNWVRNTVEFLPTYGSIQGADYTLQTLRGNPFDTASLLIALLRASGVPARYAYGTVEIPVEQVMNWVGGVATPEAAQQLLGQGGIPNVARATGGRITSIRMEHVWVEAWVDFTPSRGADNRQGETWVPLDASFKQYEFVEGVDTQAQAPFDAQAFVDTIAQNLVVDEAAGTITGIDQAFILQELTRYQQTVGDLIATQIPGATVVDSVGGKFVRADTTRTMLAASLPYRRITQDQTFSVVPDALRHKYRFTLNSGFGGTFFSQTLDLPAIANSTLALSFRPQTEQDEQTLASFIPAGATDITDLPDSIPGYLVNVVADFVVDGEVAVSGGVFQLGEEVFSQQALFSPARGWRTTADALVAGEYRALGVDVVQVSETKMQAIEARLEATRALLESADTADPGLTTRDRVVGDVLQAGILGYFVANDTQDQLAANIMDVRAYSLPSYGSFYTTLRTSYFFGLIPRSVSFTGVTMDVNFVEHMAVSPDNDTTNAVNFVRATGNRLSAFEHIIPEELLSDPGNDIESISTVKALALAMQQGQVVRVVTQANAAAMNDVVIDADARAEIIAAIGSGMEVTVHEAPITLADWTGSGYQIIDPATGSGAYKISGGANGSDTVRSGANGFRYAAVLSRILGFDSLVTGNLRRVSVALSFTAGLAEIFEACANRTSTGNIAWMIIIYTIMSIAIVALLASFGVFAWFVLSILLNMVRDFVNQVLFYLSGCAYRT